MRIVAVLLVFFEPLRFASEALRVLRTIADRGALAGFELAVHGAIAALCAAAGLALWNGSPDGRRLAMLAVTTSVARVVQSLYWSTLPNDTPPGDQWFVLAMALTAGAAALLVLARARRPA